MRSENCSRTKGTYCYDWLMYRIYCVTIGSDLISFWLSTSKKPTYICNICFAVTNPLPNYQEGKSNFTDALSHKSLCTLHR